MSTNFFSQQDLARRNTRILIVLFSVAVLLLLLLTNALVMFGLGFIAPDTISDPVQLLPWDLIAIVSLIVIGSIAVAVLVKWLQLRKGGKAVAEMLGGSRLATDSAEPLQRQLLNVVEEMALAANVPVPPVYILPETGINAFAAGYSPADAVIGVTQGCLELLNREQLQGVIAHEFSHILNGDMRMNIRIIAILNGILFLGHVGYLMLRSGSATRHVGNRSGNAKNNNGAALAMMALGLIIVGYIGSFFGNLIKAAVSRQREFLADASAVQFTRNPAGIAGALKKIGSHSSGSQLKSSNADENSHLFFGEAISRWTSIFATHPPLQARILRLEPQWNGKFSDQPDVTDNKPANDPTSPQTDQKQQFIALLPSLLLHGSRQLLPAQAIICALLLQQKPNQQQQELIRQADPVLLPEIERLYSEIPHLNLLQQVQLLQRSIPALKTMGKQQFLTFEKLISALAGTASEHHFPTWLFLKIAGHSVATEFRPAELVTRVTAHHLSDITQWLLPLLAATAEQADGPDAQVQAWQAALLELSLPLDTNLPVIDYQQLNTGLPLLQGASPALKQQILTVLQHVINADSHNTAEEQALLLALTLLLEIPYSAG